VLSHTQQSKQGTQLWVSSNGWKKIKFEEEAICEILVADSNSESGAKAADVRTLF